MKITKKNLQRLISEELQKLLQEQAGRRRLQRFRQAQDGDTPPFSVPGATPVGQRSNDDVPEFTTSEPEDDGDTPPHTVPGTVPPGDRHMALAQEVDRVKTLAQSAMTTASQNAELIARIMEDIGLE